MTSRTLAKRLIALAKQPKTLVNVMLAKSLVGEITAIRLEIEKKEKETQDLYLCVLKWINLKQESSDVDKIFFKCPIVIMTSFNRNRLMLKV